MKNNVADLGKTPTGNSAEETLMQSPVPSENFMLFQIFFLSTDDNQNVEVVETEEIDFEEIIQRLKMGENVFIKYKRSEAFEPIRKTEKKNKKKPWYFTRC
ncbi:hypothetical protein MUO98_00890 [Candidatus Bathyarchaeota archaeon]|nr:hypothetical protein [Candidatus Bathyarchaeota archaeon]